jgi:general stress protein YciG
LTKRRRREIASSGGRAAHAKGVAHQWTSAEAVLAGKKGGQATKKKLQQLTSPPAKHTDSDATTSEA